MNASRPRSSGSRIVRFLRRSLIFLFICVCLILSYLCTLGVPSSLVRHLEAFLSSDHYAVEMNSAVLRPLSGILLEDVRLFPRGKIGAAACAYERLTIRLHWQQLLGEAPPLRAIRAENGKVLTARFHKRAGDEKAEWPDTDFDLVLDDVEIDGVMFNHLSARTTSGEHGLKLDALSALVSRSDSQGTLEGSIAFGSRGEFGFDLRAVCDPAVFLPVTDARKMVTTSRIIRSTEMSGSNPRWHAVLERGPGKQADFALDAEIKFADLAYKGVPLLRADMQCRIVGGPSNLVVRVSDILLIREEGVLRGEFTARQSPGSKEMEFDVGSTFHPEALTRMIGIMTNHVNDFRFEAPYKIASRGRMDFIHTDRTEIEGSMAFGALTHDVLTLDRCRFDMQINGSTTRLENVQGLWCGGQAEGSYTRVQSSDVVSNQHVELSFHVHDADFKTIMESVFARMDDQQTGKLSGRIDLSGVPGAIDRDSLIGKGSMRIKDARLFRMPIFGGFTERVVAVVPGLDLVLRPSDVSARFVIKNGTIHTDELLIDGNVLSLVAAGKYWFDGKLRFDVELKFLKSKTFVADVIRFATYPLSKLFKFRLRGTRTKPEWETVNF
jgi:hypothetical protein